MDLAADICEQESQYHEDQRQDHVFESFKRDVYKLFSINDALRKIEHKHECKCYQHAGSHIHIHHDR